MQCPSCNKTVENEWKTCPWCETKLTSSSLAVNFLDQTTESEGLQIVDSDHAEKKEAEERLFAQRQLELSETNWADIPAGEFITGSPDGEAERSEDECRNHVKTNGFRMLTTPVTFAMYDAFCDASMREKPKDQGWGRSNRPVINVEYWDAVDYCKFLSQRTGWSVRLPTQEEWEYACRAGTTTPFWMGSTIRTDQANYDGSHVYGNGCEGMKSKQTSPVDMFQPNPWGLYDMHGNVWEWCASEDDAQSNLGLQDDEGNQDDDPTYVLHGGAWNFKPGYLRAANRFTCVPTHASHNIGFRIICDS